MSYNIVYEYDNEYDNELNEFEAIQKGYRRDVVVNIDNKKFKLYITDMTRLHQDYDAGIEYYGKYENMPNTIIVKEASKAEIAKTIKELIDTGFFDELGCSN